ncbi:hypothetical protein NliqN6_1718 [Naganishia liquefaciens]|uniref:NADP-dependent oxidoreductase domain-containing protein n=1 Tax=Naganishia liquefaciens TaxID=104408 RepID=A0A8H3YF36_9TREE|nr:hypothetical protein NliqN6_1718 [Naganishia liquefaciens]
MADTATPAQRVGPDLKMLDGRSIPQLGLGVYEMTNDEAYRAVKWALDAGYRHIDTAEWYENEHACGKAISDWLEDHPGVTREEIFYTTKLKTNVSRLDTVDKIKRSLKTSTLSYIDLYLLHSPIGGADIRRECWAGCVDAKEYGWVKSIGVSNYGVKHIGEFTQQAGAEVPVLNQLDNHPFMRRPEIVAACEKQGILIEAWGPLVRGQRFNHPTITSLATKHAKTPAQVLLRWSIQHGFIAIPKSVSQARIQENAQIFDFELDAEDMKQMDALDEYLVTDWDVVDEP